MVEGLELVVGDDESLERVKNFDDRGNLDELAVAGVENWKEEGLAPFAGLAE